MLLLRTVGMAAAMLVLGNAVAADGQRQTPGEVRATEYALKQQWVPPASTPTTVRATVSYSGTTAGGPNWNRPFADCTGQSGLGPVNYHVQPFSVDTTGAYNIASEQDGWDGYIFVYQNAFDPTQPNTNCVIGNDDGTGGIGTSNINGVSLTAGVSYHLVTTAFELGEEGPFDNEISGPGNITLGGGGPSADLGLTKSAPDGVASGGNYTYLLTASNAGPEDATGVSVVDTLPAGVSFVSSTCGATPAGQTVTWAIGNLANGANASCTLTVSRPDLTCGTVVNTATISGAEADPVSGNNTASHSNGGGNVVTDGGFEAEDAPAWAPTSSNFGTVWCTAANCGTGGGTAGPRTGTGWLWFGGASTLLETGSAQQAVTIPVGATNLVFGYWLGVCGTGGANDFIRATVGGTEVWRRDANSAECGAAGYSLATVDISSFATGASQVVRFESTSGTAGDNANFHIDDVSLLGSPTCTEPTGNPEPTLAPPVVVPGNNIWGLLLLAFAVLGLAGMVLMRRPH